MLRAYPGGGAPGYGTGPLGASCRHHTEKASVRHPSGADPDGLAAADQRHRLSWWAARGLLPEGLPPSTIAAAYTRATGRPPARDTERGQYKAYSAWELLQALAQLSREQRQKAIAAAQRIAATAPPLPPPPPPPPAPPPETVWLLALGWLAIKGAPVFRFAAGRLLGVIPQGKPGEVLAVVELPNPELTADERSWLGHALANATRRRLRLQVLPEWHS